MSGRCASYWNAFLFRILIKFMVKSTLLCLKLCVFERDEAVTTRKILFERKNKRNFRKKYLLFYFYR